MSVHAPFLQANVGDPALHGWPAQEDSAQSLFPLQSLSIPSEQLVSVVALAGLGVQALPAVQAPDAQTPAAPPESVQVALSQVESAAQLAWHATARDTKEMLLLTVDDPAVIETVVVGDVQPGALRVQVRSVS
jgi:hypothetical protein